MSKAIQPRRSAPPFGKIAQPPWALLGELMAELGGIASLRLKCDDFA